MIDTDLVPELGIIIESIIVDELMCYYFVLEKLILCFFLTITITNLLK